MSLQEHDQKLIDALKALCRIAQVNWPRDTDIRVSTGNAAVASGSVTIPSRLLAQLLQDAERSDAAMIQAIMSGRKD